MLTISPLLGAFLAAGGFVLAGLAVKRRDDMELMFGLMFCFVLVVGVIRVGFWLFGI